MFRVITPEDWLRFICFLFLVFGWLLLDTFCASTDLGLPQQVTTVWEHSYGFICTPARARTCTYVDKSSHVGSCLFLSAQCLALC